MPSRTRRSKWKHRPTAPTRTPLEFIGANPVFRLEEFAASQLQLAPRSVASALQYHVRTGRLFNPRRKVYLRAARYEWDNVDPWLLGSRLTSDAVLAYDGALSFHRIIGLGHHVSLTSSERIRHFAWNDVEYSAITPSEREDRAARTVRIDGVNARVWSPEAAFVGCLDCLDLSPGLEELAQGFVRRDFDPDGLHIASTGRSDTAAVRLGVLIERNPMLRARYFVTDALRERVTKSTLYLDPSRSKRGRYLRRWNAIAPAWMLEVNPNLR